MPSLSYIQCFFFDTKFGKGFQQQNLYCLIKQSIILKKQSSNQIFHTDIPSTSKKTYLLIHLKVWLHSIQIQHSNQLLSLPIYKVIQKYILHRCPFNLYLIIISPIRYRINHFNIISCQRQMNKVNQKYAYIAHPNNLPLQVNGNSKKRRTPIKKEQYNGGIGSINQSSRSFILKKMSNNIHNLDHAKSILPSEVQRKKSKPNSIKIFNEEKENIKSSGVEYLMQKSQILKRDNYQKAHIPQFVPSESRPSQKKHFAPQTIVPLTIQNHNPKCHKQTCEVKIVNDIYSNVYRAQKENNPSKKMQTANLFRNAEDLGLEKKREKKVSNNKMMELVGEYNNEKRVGLRQKRQDWRISNINFF